MLKRPIGEAFRFLLAMPLSVAKKPRVIICLMSICIPLDTSLCVLFCIFFVLFEEGFVPNLIEKTGNVEIFRQKLIEN